MRFSLSDYSSLYKGDIELVSTLITIVEGVACGTVGHSTYVKVSRQLYGVGRFLPPLCEFQKSNSGHQTLLTNTFLLNCLTSLVSFLM